MKHPNDDWEKEIQKEPFAESPFTEKHKQHVLRQVSWSQTTPKQTGELHPPGRIPNGRMNPRKRRLRTGSVMGGIVVAALAGAFILWNGQIVEPVVERFYPTASLQLSDDPSMSLLTDKMKRTVAITMRDYLGKQLQVTLAKKGPITGWVYVEAGQELETDYAQMWLDGETGALVELNLRGEIPGDRLEHRFVRQIPGLLADIGSDSTMKPVRVLRSAIMKKGEEMPIMNTSLTLQKDESYGEIRWRQDQAIYVSGDLTLDTARVTAEILETAQEAIKGLSGESKLPLRGVNYTRDDDLSEESINLTFGDHYFVRSIQGKAGTHYMVMDYKGYTPELKSMEDHENYVEELLGVEEEIIRQHAAPMVKQIFNIDLNDYTFYRDSSNLGMASFRPEGNEDPEGTTDSGGTTDSKSTTDSEEPSGTKDEIQIRYTQDARITMIERIQREENGSQ
ncbi:hypothetical protein J2W91_005382 [Paenibacillus amylolyticus]|uniref:Uncharacterized protein n=1 Tax=Paenibacillus amylolyticus TaxID=1451 RepID=A0AAP5LRU0_PAEAM|nr:hypothetical protein [Paenibacillus amylolyticus]MDR6726858.1 hypothetical protein [Paenibacillus amylolyticus]